MKLGERILIEDISNGSENVPIPVINDLDDDGPPNIVYLQKRRALPIPDDNGVNLEDYLKNEAKTCPGCSCDDDCRSKEKCACRLKTKEEVDRWEKLWEQTGNNRTNPFKEFPLTFYECNSNCSCRKDTCENRMVQKKIQLPLQIFKTPKMGWGVRCSEPIPKATFIAKYTGTILQRNFMNKLQFLRGKILPGCYMAKLINIGQIYTKRPGEFSSIMDEWEFGVDAGFPTNGPYPGGNVTRFFNHSCDPNIISRLVFIETHDTRLPELAFFALRDIEAGEQIFWDYAYDASPNSSFNCQCGKEKCRWKKCHVIEEEKNSEDDETNSEKSEE